MEETQERADGSSASQVLLRRRRSRERSAGLLGLLLVVLTALTLASFASRGFDLSDESLYIYDIRRGQALADDFSQYHVLLNRLFRSDTSVASMRVAALALDLITATILAISAWTFAMRWRLAGGSVHPLPWIAAAAAAQLLGHTWLPATPSYNNVNSWLVNIALAVALQLLRRERWWPLGVPLGMVLALQIFVKWPTAVVLGCAFIASMVVCGRVKAAACTLVAAGATLVLAGPVNSGFDFSNLVRSGTTLGDSDAYGPSSMLLLYWQSTEALMESLVTSPTGAAAIGLVTLAILCASDLRWALLGSVIIGTVLLWDGTAQLILESSYVRRLVPSVVVLMVATTLGWALFDSRRGDGSNDVLLAQVGGLLLFLSAFAASFGTYNDLWLHLQASAAPIGVLGIALATYVGRPFLFLPLVLTFSVLAMHGSIVDPYRQVDLRAQDVWDPVLGLYVDGARASVFDDVRRTTGPYLAGRGHVFVGFERPGWALVVNAPIAGPTWTGSQAEATERLCPAVRRRRDEFDRVSMAVLTEPLDEDARTCLVGEWPEVRGRRLVKTIEATDGRTVRFYALPESAR